MPNPGSGRPRSEIERDLEAALKRRAVLEEEIKRHPMHNPFRRVYLYARIWLHNSLKSITLVKIAALVVIVYFAILIYGQLRPLSYQEKYMHCLELGSNARAQACINLLRNNT